MTIVVTTSRNVLLVDPSQEKYQILHTGKGLYYGITYDDRYLYVGARNNYTGDREHQANESGSILVFRLNDLELVKEIIPPFPLRDIHQICLHQGILFVTCSYDNLIAMMWQGAWFEWHPGDRQEADINHFNSLYFKGNKCYLAAHNLEEPSEIWVYRDWFKMKLFMHRCFKSGKMLRFHCLEKIPIGRWIHNVFLTDKKELVTCSSKEGVIMGTDGFHVDVGMFPRGLSVGHRRIFLGLSELNERSERDFSNSYLLDLDSTWKVVKKFKLRGMGLLLDLATPGIDNLCFTSYRGSAVRFSEDRETFDLEKVSS